MTLAYYVTAHGYGHGVRSCDIIRSVSSLRPEVEVIVVSDLPQAFFANRLPATRYRHRPGSFDVGMVQLDSIRVDVAATLQRVEALLALRERLARQEADFLCAVKARLAVADIPALPFEAARRAGIPGIAVGNFGWDWIYSAYAGRDSRWSRASSAFAADYGKAELLLRLPFSEGMSAFSRREDVPVLASTGRGRRGEIAARTGAAPEHRWALLSFTTLDWDEEALRRVEKIEGCEFFTVRPLEWRRRNIHPVDRDEIPFSDVAASVDVVISKPGFGIVSDCIANRKPLIYAEREDFAEFPILEAAIRRHLRHRHIPSERLYRGDLTEALEAIERLPPPLEPIELGGDVVAARRILDFL